MRSYRLGATILSWMVVCSVFDQSRLKRWSIVNILHATVAPAVRRAVKTELSYRNDSIIVFFFAANKTKDNFNVSLASSNISLQNSGFNLTRNNNSHNCFPTWRHSTKDEWIAGRRRLIFGVKWRAWRHKIFHIFHFLQSDTVFGIINPFPHIFNAIFSEKSCPTSIPFTLTTGQYSSCHLLAHLFIIKTKWTAVSTRVYFHVWKW